MPIPADAHHDHGLPWLDFGGIDRRAPASANTATQQARLVQPGVAGDLDGAVHADDCAVRERGNAAHLGSGLTIDLGPERAVGPGAIQQRGSQDHTGFADPMRTNGICRMRGGNS